MSFRAFFIEDYFDKNVLKLALLYSEHNVFVSHYDSQDDLDKIGGAFDRTCQRRGVSITWIEPAYMTVTELIRIGPDDQLFPEFSCAWFVKADAPRPSPPPFDICYSVYKDYELSGGFNEPRPKGTDSNFVSWKDVENWMILNRVVAGCAGQRIVECL